MSARDLENQLKKEEFAGWYLLYGDEGFLTAHYAKAIAARAVPAVQEFNLHRFSMETFDPSKLAAAMQNLPLMAPRTCVLLGDIDPDALKANVWKAYLSELSDVPKTCVAVVYFTHVPFDKKSARWRALLNLAKKSGQAELFARPTARELERWTARRAKKAGASITAEAAAALSEACSGDMNRMASEIEKLAAYTAGGEIGKDAVDALVARDITCSIYDLARAVTAGRLSAALGILDELFYQKEEPVIILSALSQAFCDLYRAAVASHSGKGEAVLAADFPYRGREFRIRNALRDCRRLSVGYLRVSLAYLLDADTALKSTRADDRLILERLCVDLAALGKRGAVG